MQGPISLGANVGEPMFEKTIYHCPNCDAMVRQEIKDEEEFACQSCGRRYKVMLDRETGKAGFIEAAEKEIPEPLFLPKGSIRALVTVAMSLSCWLLIFAAKDVPGYLLSLLLTIIGYYFGFRKKIKTAESRIFDASAREEDPLFLPHGVIRVFFIVGFVISGLVLFSAGRLKELRYLEFFVVLLGLILGYAFARVFSSYEGSPLYILINHLKGALVLAAGAYLAYLLVTGGHSELQYVSLLLAAMVSFYFGSRS